MSSLPPTGSVPNPAAGAGAAPSPAALPPDRAAILTEQRNPRSMHLHRLGVRECVDLIGDEDAAVLEAMRAARPALATFVEAILPGFLAGGRLIYLGAGTSGRLGVLDASEAPPTFQIEPGRIIGIIAGGDSALRISSEGKEDDPEGARPELERLNLTGDDAVLAIAAGGTTPYALGALRVAKSLAPVTTGLLCCTTLPEKPAWVDHLIAILTGPEVVTGSTRMKAGTATKLALNTISTTLMIQCGRVYENLMVDLRASNAKLRDRAARIVATLTGSSRVNAFELVDAAGGSVKVAIVMSKLGVDRSRAEAYLARAAGRLDVALRSDQGDTVAPSERA
ncbi:MAG: N-acetylmuramic acid 6-phosphate etherase [Planctomycetota bacterium]|nr:N-acetylmuramic acid 6-phosphate etherase [Planctomycetota bacterium]